MNRERTTTPTRRLAFRIEFLKALAAAIPVAVLQPFLVRLVGPFSESPWLVAAVLLPLAAGVVLLGIPLVRDGRVLLGGGFLFFFLCYILLFSVAYNTELLQGRRETLAGYERDVPRNFLGLNWLGDWHYWLSPRSPVAHDLTIVSLPSFEGVAPDVARRKHAALISQALEEEAKGIAFDYVFQGESAADNILCHWVRRAEEEGLPLLFGYGVDVKDGVVTRRSLPARLRECIGVNRLASLAGYRESDGKVRMVPLFFRGDRSFPSLSYRIARELAEEELASPRQGLLQFLEPEKGIVRVDGSRSEGVREHLKDRFVIVGSHREGDRHETPFGRLLGVEIHAYAAHGLRTDSFVRRLGASWSFVIIFAFCYLLTAVQASGRGGRALVGSTALLSIVIVGTAALAMRWGMLWIDVSYQLVSIWLLTGLLTSGASLQRSRVLAASSLPVSDSDSGGDTSHRAANHVAPFDVFLSHNSEDKAAVRALAEALADRGLRVWLDEDQLVPGRPWQDALEEIIRTVGSVAVLVGEEGFGSWERPEMRASLDQAVARDMPVIPVLLPGASEQPRLPLFLKQHTWVDLRAGINDEAIDKLEWGITGVRPRRHGHRRKVS